MEEKMKTIQTNVYIKQPGLLTLDIPEAIPLGEHKVVVVIDDETGSVKNKSLLGLWKEYGRAPGSKEIEEMRKDAWGTLREGIFNDFRQNPSENRI